MHHFDDFSWSSVESAAQMISHEMKNVLRPKIVTVSNTRASKTTADYRRSASHSLELRTNPYQTSDRIFRAM